MKQVGIILGFVIIVAMFMIANKSYYPPLPIDHLSAKDALEKLKSSDERIVEIATDNDYTWYITKSQSEVDENIKQMISSNGWEFKEKEGSGLFFEKEGERLIATTQMWTKKYVLVQLQNTFKEL
ncbi:hypothetical protein MHZ95_07140 [Sporosarcina sp. ACRSM]|uniref:hypothetical protein n=1 Tax=Sporosarcina sp. ACRSM TaxID=2918216 RepID=UPI001EF74D85|nr:hypothetical protein [Sporosarcina sp. ACRSM]MCG7335048.1 hypothetical protein [Sporosarcina sp. ACRSM]